MNKALLYSFRRCPYAIRARLAIAVAGIDVETIEIDLKNKPAGMLAISPKATVPVLQLPDGRVIDESLEIMLWALSINDPQSWLQGRDDALVGRNDGEFKYYLDRYKYADRYPEYSAADYRHKAEVFISELESRLNQQQFLTGDQPRLVDMAIAPFVRQFAQVDKDWFNTSQYKAVIRWLNEFLVSELFLSVMKK